ncbi:sodium/proline symporter PutP [Rossellomorea vietnamensis]|uniref:Sodium/proline symporter n=2 Tax=Rossellomorea TaxID=2837508 RepID=A0A5D4K9W6_9BACI|nr:MULTISPECIES: sodium/proline symporter PutP [Rossellomorea]TYR73659.1 sodium/proline symporter PutP [Rossellomorea vietnamensis]TYS72059.1 sodium/proline symporter PutP [Rossellomorea aquimaris]
MDTATLVTFIVYLVGMLAIGIISYRLTSNLSDYVLGGRSLKPGVAALSAGASDMSSWLLLGLPGAAYASGLGSIWLAIGLTIGAYLNWKFVASRLRSYTEVANDSITVPDFFENRFKDGSRILRVISALVILIFFTFYTSSGLVGGAILFQESFEMSYNTALLIGAIVIISYTFLGGFLAVSWTDFIQGILMFLALVVAPIVAITELGGWGDTMDQVTAVNPEGLDLFAGASAIGVISLLAWGLGYFGQPHIITRFMALRSTKDVPKARLIGMSWMIVSVAGAVLVGLAGIAYFAADPLIANGVDNSEKVFILFTDVLFNPWVSGILLAAILSAIMSTIDSQLLVSSSALAEDFYKAILRKNASDQELVWVGRFGVILIAVIAVLLALGGNPANENASSILDLVSYAWAGFGSAFGPVIVLALFWKGMTRNGALAGMITGAVTVVVWPMLETELYEMVPGFILATLAIIIFSKVGPQPSEEIKAEFDSAVANDITK